MNKLPFLALVSILMCGLSPTLFGERLTLDMTPVGDPRNPADKNGYGSVLYPFEITPKNISNKQYAKFLNVVDPAGVNERGLFNSQMMSQPEGGIVFDPAAKEGKKYQVKQGMDEEAVRFVNWPDAARFANWLTNGADKGCSTEVGAYNLKKSKGQMIARERRATYWIPNPDELYKAGFYQRNGAWVSQSRVFYAGDPEEAAKNSHETAIKLPIDDGRINEIVDVESSDSVVRQVSYMEGFDGGPKVPFSFAGATAPMEETDKVSFYIASDPDRDKEERPLGNRVFYSGGPEDLSPNFGSFGGSAGGGGGTSTEIEVFEEPPPAS